MRVCCSLAYRCSLSRTVDVQWNQQSTWCTIQNGWFQSRFTDLVPSTAIVLASVDLSTFQFEHDQFPLGIVVVIRNGSDAQSCLANPSISSNRKRGWYPTLNQGMSFSLNLSSILVIRTLASWSWRSPSTCSSTRTGEIPSDPTAWRCTAANRTNASITCTEHPSTAERSRLDAIDTRWRSYLTESNSRWTSKVVVGESSLRIEWDVRMRLAVCCVGRTSENNEHSTCSHDKFESVDGCTSC